jgi:hypothetical protein
MKKKFGGKIYKYYHVDFRSGQSYSEYYPVEDESLPFVILSFLRNYYKNSPNHKIYYIS